MFVGALFRDSSGKILNHYRYLVDEVEDEANIIAQKQIEEEENRLNFLEMVSFWERNKNFSLNDDTYIVLVWSKNALKGNMLSWNIWI